MGDAEGESRLASPPIFFLDENHCRNKHLHAAFQVAQIEFRVHLDFFSPGTEDVVWLPEVARRHWVLLTADAQIRRNVLERESVRSNRLRMFYFARNDFSGAELGRALATALPRMVRLCQSEPAPFAASITRHGEVNVRDRFPEQGGAKA